MSTTSCDVFDVIIVGAGVSGLTAAYEIHKHNNNNNNENTNNSNALLKVKILEANPTRVGGRNYVDSEGTDLGSGYIGPTQDRVSHLIDELDLKLYKVYTEGKTIQFVRGSPTPFDGTIPPVSFLGLLDVNNAMVHIDAIATSVNLEAPHLTPNAAELDSVTVAEYMRRNCATADAMNLMRTAVRAVCCVEPSELSVLAFAWYVRSSGNIKRVVETKDGAQDAKVVGGTGRISLELAKRLPQDWIQLDSPVREINITGGDTSLVSVTGKNFTYMAKTVILAIPPCQQFRIDFTPPLSSQHRQALQHFPMGHIIKTFTFYERPFWREKGLNGSIVCDEGIGLVCIDDTKPDGSMPCIMGFVLSADAAIWSSNAKTPQDRRDALAKQYAKAFGCDEALRPINYKEKCWADEAYVGGCYVGVPTPTTLTKFPNEVNGRSSIAPQIMVAGTEAAADFVGYLEGAVEAGQRSARNVLVQLGHFCPRDKYFNLVTKPAEPSKQNPFVEMDLSWAERKLIPSVSQLMWLSCVVVAGVVSGGLLYFSEKRKIK